MMMMQQQQQQAAAGGFSPPPNVTAPTGMDNPMAGTAMNQPGQQPFNYGGNYGGLTSSFVGAIMKKKMIQNTWSVIFTQLVERPSDVNMPLYCVS